MSGSENGGPKVVVTTAPDEAVASSLARHLVEHRLAACVQLVAGVRSMYRWRGRIEEASEVQVWVKTTAGRVDEVVAAIERLHPYDVPEVLVFPVDGGASAYLHWLGDETREPRS